ncbi:MAG: gamma-glutamylcyclotransferase, partial [Alphaproteobacteria bacterium]|nr:gamma-glutamylcyclotransferase [Alphaproteobacteria bacterium]
LVRGWRRSWRHTNLRAVAYLTVEPAPRSAIQGLIASVPNDDWSALDQREHAYDRVALSPSEVDCAQGAEISVQLYKTSPKNDAPPSVRHPVLQSYLDTVVAGYLDVFGAEGASDFFASTTGWDAPILDDRHEPIYPRTTTIDAATRRFIDTKLDALGVERVAKTDDIAI